MKYLLNSLAALSLVAVAAPAVAQSAGAQNPAPRMARAQAPQSEADYVARRTQDLRAADANSDGQVTPEERRAQRQKMRAERTEARFTRLDSNADGQISREEFAAGNSRMGRMAHARGEGMHPRGEGHMRTRTNMRQNMRQNMGTHHAMAEQTISIANAEQKARESFVRLDANRDGQVTAEERRAARQASHQARRAERNARQPSPSAPVSE